MTKGAVLVLVYLACAGHGRRVQSSEQTSKLSARASSQGALDPMRSLAMAILALDPAAAFNPVPAMRFLAGNMAAQRPRNALMLEQPESDVLPSRRAALRNAASASIAWLSLLASPQAARSISEQLREKIEQMAPSVGQGGQLSTDIGESITKKSVEVLITDVSYKEMGECPKNFFRPKVGKWECIEVSATALNQGRRNPARAADVYGNLYDAEGGSPAAVSLDGGQKAPLASLVEDFPRDKKKKVTWVMAVEKNAARPFTFAGLKGSYQSAGAGSIFKPFNECELNTVDEEC